MTTNIDLRRILSMYCVRGFFLFPLGQESKRPCIKNNLEEASNDIKQLMKWEKEFPGCNWGLSLAKSGLVAIDIDQGGLEAWAVYVEEYGEPKTLKAKSGSGIGSHYIFNSDLGKRYRGKLCQGIDVKHNGYIAVYPSVHPKTKRRYGWVLFSEQIAPLPEWLKLEIEKPEFKKHDPEELYSSPETARFESVVEELKEKTFDYASWVKMGMALHSAFKGSDEGLGIFLDITGGASYKEGDNEIATRKWDSFTSKGDLSAASFFYEAGKLGCTIPQEGKEDDKALFKSEPIPEIKSKKKKPEWVIDKTGLQTTDNAKFLIKEVNSWGYAMLGSNLTGHIIMQWLSENGVPHFRVIQKENFNAALKDRALEMYGKNGIKTVPASEIWGQSSWKAKYRNVVFKPNADFEDLNLWCDIPCARKKGDVSLILELIYVLCGEDEIKARYLLQWFAHLMQKPEEKPVIVPVFIGEQGAGKGMLFDEIIRRILTADFYIKLDKAGTIKEKFNVEQARKFMTVLDEASWRGDHELASVMKSLTGSSTMTVEEKFGARYPIENYSRYVILSNDIEAVRVELSNRRYIVFSTSNAWKGTDKFGELMKKLRTENLHEAFYDYLLGVDISSFDPYVFPSHIDTSGDETKVASMSAVGQFWSDMFFEEPQKLFQEKEDGIYLSKNHAFNAFIQYVGTVRPLGKRFSRRAFTIETETLMPVLRGSSTRCRLKEGNERAWLISPREMLQSFCLKARLAPPSEFVDAEYFDTGDFDKL